MAATLSVTQGMKQIRALSPAAERFIQCPREVAKSVAGNPQASRSRQKS
jgi:hypothetical protein